CGSVEGMRAGSEIMGTCWRGRTSYSSGISCRHELITRTLAATSTVERGYGATEAVAESTRCLMCNYNIWFDPFRCVLCGACADVCPEGVIHMIDITR
ncbi:MAG: 4Fe-4S binding protein, partial [Candidatus Limnocylindrales bacterium]